MQKLPLGILNFREIIENNYVYIDKTQYIYNMFNDAKYTFLSRPRRFGKSLLVDTIAETFSGDKDLYDKYNFASDAFKFLIIWLNKKYGQKVVILIDEYDKPILDNLNNAEIAEANRRILSEAGVLLFQSGYLTVKNVSRYADEDVYKLGIPNFEVKKAFDMHVATALTYSKRRAGRRNDADEK